MTSQPTLKPLRLGEIGCGRMLYYWEGKPFTKMHLFLLALSDQERRFCLIPTSVGTLLWDILFERRCGERLQIADGVVTGTATRQYTAAILKLVDLSFGIVGLSAWRWRWAPS